MIDEGYPGNSTYTNIGEIVSLEHLGGGEVGERDTTVLSSTAHTSAPTIPDNGEVTIELNWDPTDAVHKFIRNLKDAPPFSVNTSFIGFNTFKAVFATGNTNTSSIFNAWVKNFDGATAGGVDENLTASVTLRVTGSVNSTP